MEGKTNVFFTLLRAEVSLTKRQVESVFIPGWYEPVERSKGGPPHGLLQVVTSAIHGAVTVVVAHVVTVHHSAVLLTARQPCDDAQLSRG